MMFRIVSLFPELLGPERITLQGSMNLKESACFESKKFTSVSWDLAAGFVQDEVSMSNALAYFSSLFAIEAADTLYV